MEGNQPTHTIQENAKQTSLKKMYPYPNLQHQSSSSPFPFLSILSFFFLNEIHNNRTWDVINVILEGGGHIMSGK
jgi:hypothetical protein